MLKPNISRHHSQKGGALLYILIAIALLAALTASLTGGSSSLGTSQNAAKLKMELKGQIAYIRNAIQECVTNYPAGDPTVNVASTTDAGYIAPYPVTPNSTHFTGSTLGVAADKFVEYLRCPGNPGVDNNHTPLFGDVSGKTAPVHPLGSDWNYVNKDFTFLGETTHGVYIRFDTAKTDGFIKKALQEIVSEYGECEGDYIEGNGTNGCGNNLLCLRIWLVRSDGC